MGAVFGANPSHLVMLYGVLYDYQYKYKYNSPFRLTCATMTIQSCSVALRC